MDQDSNLPSLYNDDGDGFIIIAHRGASAYYPENTMIAFEKGMEMGAEMLEIDVTLSKDKVPVVFHDAKLNRHTNGKGYVSDFTLEELRQLDAGSWFSKQYAGQQMPTLEEVIDFASGNISLNIEIKPEAVSNDRTHGVEEQVINLVKKYDMESHISISSFDYRALEKLNKLAPRLSTALLYNKKQSGSILPHQLVKMYKVDAFNCSYRQLSKKWISDLHEHNIPSFIYTVDAPSKMRQLISAGVKGIFTNKPDVLRSVAQKQLQSS